MDSSPEISPHLRGHKSQLYLVSPPRIDLSDFSETFHQVLSLADVASFQLRLKDVPDTTIIEATAKLMPIAHEYDVAFVLNDRPDLAHQLNTDGVHVGQEDMPYGEAREIVGPDRIVGVTCHDSRHLAMTAAEQGADYVAFGAFYPSATKDSKAINISLDILTWWQEMMNIPCVAIGGIGVGTAGKIAAAGADFIAISNGIWNYPHGAAESIRLINAELVRTTSSET